MLTDLEAIRNDFPILNQMVGKYPRLYPLVYFDNAATTQKPIQVTNALADYYNRYNSNIHRGVHHLSQIATEAFENGRENIKTFINAKNAYEIIFTRGTTESINLVASSFCRKFVGKDDEIIVSEMEHHSNIVPWQMACEDRGAYLKVLPFDNDGVLQLEKLEELITPKTKLIAVAHVSNALGTINPIKKIIELAHSKGVKILIDGAQAVSHLAVDVQALDCDFYCFSGHKLYAPMGVGVLYGKEELLNAMPPYQGGGEMIKEVTFAKTTYNELPYKFEAGTPSVGDVIGLDVAIKYVQKIGLNNIAKYEDELLHYCTQELLKIEGITIIGTAPEKTSVVSFVMKNIHPYDAGTIIDKLGIAVRTGHHCAQPVMDHYKIPGTIRASFAFYNTKEEVDRLILAVKQVKEMFE
ncbi:MAG: cysteine desulfurase [Bacteroidota bacterium]